MVVLFCGPVLSSFSWTAWSTPSLARREAQIKLPSSTSGANRVQRRIKAPRCACTGWIFAGLSGRVVDTKADVAARTDAPTARTAIGGFSTLRNKLCATTRPNERSRTAHDNFEPSNSLCNSLQQKPAKSCSRNCRDLRSRTPSPCRTPRIRALVAWRVHNASRTRSRCSCRPPWDSWRRSGRRTPRSASRRARPARPRSTRWIL